MNWLRLIPMVVMLAIVALCIQFAPALAVAPPPPENGNGSPHILPTERDESLPARGVVLEKSLPPANLVEWLSHRPPPAPPATLISSARHAGFGYGASNFLGIRGDFSAELSLTLLDTNPPKGPGVSTETFRYYHGCMEVSVTDYLITGNPQNIRALETYDWCGPGAGGDGTGGIQHVFYTDVQSWRDKYTAVSSWYSMSQDGVQYTDKTIHLRLFRSASSPYQCSELDIWNYQTGSYDWADTICGTDTSPVPGGWSMFETFGYDSQPVPPGVALGFYNVAQARNQFTYMNGSWIPIVASMVTDQYWPSGQPYPYNPLGGDYTYKWYFVSAFPGHGITGADWAVCGPDAARTASNPVCT